MTKLKKRKRRQKHAKYLGMAIAALHNEIVHEVLQGNMPTNKAKLFKKYLRRLNYLCS